jgi:hypothetical protein
MTRIPKAPKSGGGKSMQRFGSGVPIGFPSKLSSLVESRLVVGLATIALLAMASTTASAVPIVQVIWQETGTSTATVAPGTPLTAEIFMSPDAAGISAYGVSIQFNSSDLQLAAQAPEKQVPPGFQDIFPPPTATSDQVSSFGGATLGSGPTSGMLLIGLVHFIAVSPTNDGADVTPGFFVKGIDGMFDNAVPGKALAPDFLTASVLPVPEPTTALLLVPALAGLAALRRRKVG